MRKSKLLIPVLALITCLFLSAGFASLNSDRANAEDLGYPQLTLGENIVTVTEDDISNGMVITTFTVETAGWYTFKADELAVSVGDMEGNIIGSGSLELEANTYFILLGTDTIGTPGEYVATIIEGKEVAPTVHEAGQMYSHNTGIGNNTEQEFAFYFKTDANDALYNDNWSVEYGATSADNIKLTRGGVTTSVAAVGQGTIVRLNEIDHYMKFAPWTVSGVLPVQEGDVFTVSGTFKCTGDATQMFSITETTVTYVNGALKYSTDPEVCEAGQMYAHENGANPNENGGGASGFAFYFKTEANSAAYASDWSKEYGATSADNIKLTRGGVTTSVAKVGQGTVVRFSETDHYMKLVPWTTDGLLPLQEGDVLTVSGAFKCNSDATQMFRITETTVTYVNGALKFSTDPVVHEAGQMYAHENGANPNENGGGAGGFAFYFRTEENQALHGNGDWNIEYSATSADNIKLTRGGVTTSVAKTGQGTIVRLNEKDHYMKLVPWTTDGLLPLQEGDVLTVSGAFMCKSDATQMFSITETTVTYTGGKLKFSTDVVPEEFAAGYLTAHRNGGTASGLYAVADENEALFGDWDVEYAPQIASSIQVIRNGETKSVAKVGANSLVKFGKDDYYVKFEGHTVEEGYAPLQDGDIIIIGGEFYNKANNQMIIIKESVVRFSNGAYTYLNPQYVIKNADGEETDLGVFDYKTTLSEALEGETLEDAVKASDEDFDYTFIGYFVGDEELDYDKEYEGKVVVTAKFSATVKDAIESGYGYVGAETNNAYFSLADNGAPLLEDWSLRYKPLTADAVRLIRNGETVAVANLEAETIVKYGKTRYFLEINALTDTTVLDGDVYLIEGAFKYVDGEGVKTVISISATYIKVSVTEDQRVFTVLNPAVVFVDADGNEISSSSYEMGTDVYAEKPSVDPVKEVPGFEVTFAGWYNGETAWDFENNAVIGSVVLAPKFEMVAIEYDAVFKNGDDVIGTVKYTVNDTAIDEPELPACERAGYEYAWEAYELAVGGITVNTVEVAIEYTVTFVADGGTVEEITFTVETIDEIVFPAVPEKDGYEAVWDKGADELTLADTTVTAVYTEIKTDDPDESEEESEEESIEAPVTSEKESVEAPATSEEDDEEGGCGGSVGGTAILSIVGLFAAAIIRKRR